WKRPAVLGLSSTLSLPTLALPAYSVAMASTVGVIILHGPHHSAQKSTRTGTSDLKTSASNEASVKVCTLSPAMLSVSSPVNIIAGTSPRRPSDARSRSGAGSGPLGPPPQDIR